MSIINDRSKNHGWMPWTLRKPSLFMLIGLSLLLATSIEILAQKSARDGALSLSKSIDDIPNTSRLASSYLPTFVAIIYGLLWAWVDLDAKRIQPWLELSKTKGSTAHNSLLLDYPFEFLAFVPFRAARRRHWLVFYTGTIVVITFWFITPLQSSIFGAGSIRLTRPTTVSRLTSLLPISDQAPLFDVSILNEAYATTWLGQEFPPPMTPDYALLPFNAKVAIPPLATNISLNSWTWQLTTDLNCWPAIVTPRSGLHEFHFSSGRGCGVNIEISGALETPQDVQYAMLFQHYNFDGFGLEGPACGKKLSHQFLVISAERNGTADAIVESRGRYKSITALFCQPRYTKRNVSVTLSGDTLIPSEASIVPHGGDVDLLDSEFDTAAFEYLLGTSLPPVDKTRDYLRMNVLNQYGQLRDNRIEATITNMVGFIIGSQNYSATELHDPSTLASACTMAYKSLFSLTINHLLADRNAAATSGEMQYTIYGIIVSRPISAIVEALLVVVAIMASCVLYHSARCTSRLSSDPSSINDILGILQCDKAVLRDLSNLDRSDDATLREYLGDNSYFLQEKYEFDKISLYLQKNSDITSINPPQHMLSTSEPTYSPIRPTALSPAASISFIGVLLAGIGLLVYLKRQERALGGLTPPSSNFEVMQLLENYIPTIFATLLEPFWVLVNRMYCVLQPFYELQKGRGLPQRSVLAKYTSLPPQLAVWRSARSRQYLLTLICLATLLANVLALSLSGLFDEIPRVASYTTMVQPERIGIPDRESLIPPLSQVDYRDAFEVLAINLSLGTRLLPWTDNNNFYLPFDAPSDRPIKMGDQFVASTLGFGMEYQCSPLRLGDLSGNLAVWLSSVNTSSQQLHLSVRLPTGSFIDCVSVSFLSPYSGFHGQKAAREFFLGFTHLHHDICWSKTPFVIGWARAHPTQQNWGGSYLMSTLLACVSNLRIARFDVTADSDGNIVNAAQTSGSLTTLEHWPANLSQSLVDEVAHLQSTGPGDWHDGSFTGDYINHLLTLLLRDRSIIDPSSDVPDAAAMRPVLEDLYRRLAATVFGLNPSFFKQATPDNTPAIPATLLRVETRIFLSEPAFILSVSILAIYILIFIAASTRARAILLPRMPTSLGSLLAYSVASQATEDFRSVRDDSSILKHTYTLGRYIGSDGKPHIGIERDPFVVKLDERDFDKKRPKMKSWWLLGNIGSST